MTPNAFTDMKQWLTQNKACEQGFEWAVANCKSVSDIWHKVLFITDKKKPKEDWFFWVASRKDIINSDDVERITTHIMSRITDAEKESDWYKYALKELQKDNSDWVLVATFCRAAIRQISGLEKGTDEKFLIADWIYKNIEPKFSTKGL